MIAERASAHLVCHSLGLQCEQWVLTFCESPFRFTVETGERVLNTHSGQFTVETDEWECVCACDPLGLQWKQWVLTFCESPFEIYSVNRWVGTVQVWAAPLGLQGSQSECFRNVQSNLRIYIQPLASITSCNSHGHLEHLVNCPRLDSQIWMHTCLFCYEPLGTPLEPILRS